MKVRQFQPFLGQEEYEAIKDCFDNNWITEGPKAKEFSNKLCSLMGSKYGEFANNGTLSIYLGLRAMGIGPGDEVIVPDFTFIASANAVEMCGAKPVFADIDRETLHADIRECEKLINKKRLLITFPLSLAKLSAKLFQLFPKPLLKEDQLRLLKYDNVPSGKYKTNKDIGLPGKLFFRNEVKKYCYMWMDGGEFSTEKYNFKKMEKKN